MERSNKAPLKTIDVVVLTDRRYINPEQINGYISNVLLEDDLVVKALEAKGLNVLRRSWDDMDFDWETARVLLFRTTWDYFDRFSEFAPWLDRVAKQCILINPPEVLYWNIDKHYLGDLKSKGVNIAPTVFIEKGTTCDIPAILEAGNWEEAVVKPCISGAGRHTYRVSSNTSDQIREPLDKLLQEESMMVQEFQRSIVTEGEISLMIIGGKCTHAVLKKARKGEFRVQDDFGGTIHPHEASAEEMAFALRCTAATEYDLIYARVDIFRDNKGELCLAELELIEPELWFRLHKEAAPELAETIYDKYFRGL